MNGPLAAGLMGTVSASSETIELKFVTVVPKASLALTVTAKGCPTNWVGANGAHSKWSTPRVVNRHTGPSRRPIRRATTCQKYVLAGASSGRSQNALVVVPRNSAGPGAGFVPK